tara:strand:- start:2056 stop:2325 length:270 start_codon:yes stop_codon:yes gene_type:complete
MTDERLSRIEGKLDKLSDAVVSLARMEERMVTLFKRMDNYEEDQKLVWEKIRKLTEVSTARGHALRFMERVWWIVLTAAVASAFIYLRG